ncbi:hypothetical protein [Absidia glauca]|uniref:Uncharacterized protein n=1 Tax=Absidia glauca TaxID=4829 RepID=A0A168QF25_ABSGL|nr:hypothetical protein [Absidia glauca]
MEKPLALFRSQLKTLLVPITDDLLTLTTTIPAARPPIDSINAFTTLWITLSALKQLELATGKTTGHLLRIGIGYTGSDGLSTCCFRSEASLLETKFTKATATISRLKRNKNASASFSHPDGLQASVDTMAAHLASAYDGSLLSSASRPDEIMDLHQALPFDISDNDTIFSVESLEATISSLPTRKGPGPDHLKAEMLKAVSSIIAPVLSLLFQLCYQWSYTPALWRQAQLYPIFKKGDVMNLLT